MKSVLFATAAAVAAIVASPVLAGESSGYIDLSYAHTDVEAGSWDNELQTVSLGGAFTTGLTGDWNVQFDGRGNTLSWDSSSSDDNIGYVAAHVFKRTEDYAVGVFAGEVNYYGDGGYMGGVEGQSYIGDTVLSGSVGYAHFSNWTDYSGWNAQIGGEYFINDDFALNAGLGYAKWDDWGDDTKIWNASIGAEYKFSGSPASVFGEYRRDEIDYGSGNEYDNDTFMIGVRWNFGSASLKARETTGASLQGAAAVSRDMLVY